MQRNSIENPNYKPKFIESFNQRNPKLQPTNPTKFKITLTEIQHYNKRNEKLQQTNLQHRN